MNAAEKRKSFNIGRFYGRFGTIIILLAILVLSGFFVPSFVKTQNLSNILLQNAVVIILAYGATFVILLGHTNVSYGSVIAFIGCLACLVNVWTGSLVLTLLFALAAGAGIGLINGFIVTKFGIPAFIMTLAVAAIARGGALLITNGTPVSGMSDSFNWFGQGHIGPLPVQVVIMAALFAVVWVLLAKMRFGRHVYAVGGNENAAKASGIKTIEVTRRVFLIDGVITAVAAIVFMARQASGTPAGGVSYEFDAITAVVVGGTSLAGGSGNIVGTVIGGLIVGVINNVQNLLGVNTYWQQVVKGTIILFAVIVDVVTKRAAAKSVK